MERTQILETVEQLKREIGGLPLEALAELHRFVTERASIVYGVSLDAPRDRGDGAPTQIRLSVHCGAGRTKRWAKRVRRADPRRGNGYGLEGPWLTFSGNECRVAVPERSFLVVYAHGEKDDERIITTTIALLRVRRGARLNFDRGAQRFEGENLELVTHNKAEVETQELLDRYPELAPAVGREYFPIFAALKESGF